MDQVKIGKFISECRKKQKLTQSELAEKLNITDRAVSRWETGRGLPDSSLMLDLCNILNISVNELLSGQTIEMENCNKEIENKLIEMIKAKEEADKRLLRLEIFIGVLSLIVLFVPIILGAYMSFEHEWIRYLVIFSGFIPCIIGFSVALKIEQVAGYYKCPKCNHKYVPTYKAINMAPHIGRIRKMKCPNCGKKTWQRKVVDK